MFLLVIVSILAWKCVCVLVLLHSPKETLQNSVSEIHMLSIPGNAPVRLETYWSSIVL